MPNYRILLIAFLSLLVISCSTPIFREKNPKMVIYNGLEKEVKISFLEEKVDVKPNDCHTIKFPENNSFEIVTTCYKDTLEVFEVIGEADRSYVYNVDSAAMLVEVPIEYSGKYRFNNGTINYGTEELLGTQFYDKNGNEIVPGMPKVIGNKRWHKTRALYFFQQPPLEIEVESEYGAYANTLRWVIYDAESLLNLYEAEEDSSSVE